MKIALGKWLQRHSFGAEYTIIQPKMLKMVVVKKTGNVIFLA